MRKHFVVDCLFLPITTQATIMGTHKIGQLHPIQKEFCFLPMAMAL
jgi:hypothetical protein